MHVPCLTSFTQLLWYMGGVRKQLPVGIYTKIFNTLAFHPWIAQAQQSSSLQSDKIENTLMIDNCSSLMSYII